MIINDTLKPRCINGTVEQNTVYVCRIVRVGSDYSRRAHVIFDACDGKARAWLLSNTIDADGIVDTHYTWPLKEICTSIYDIFVEEVAACQGKSYRNVEDFAYTLGCKARVRLMPDGTIRVFERMDPPKGTPVPVGVFTTPTGDKEVFKYPDNKLLKIVDKTTGAAVDIERSDLLAYLV